MKPIEAMARAYQDEFELWSFGHYEMPGDHVVWRDHKEIARGSDRYEMVNLLRERRQGASMRAALLALAEVELDDMTIDHAPGMIWGTTGDMIDMASNNFRAICRALAEENATPPSTEGKDNG